MSDPLKGKYCQNRHFKTEFEKAKKRLNGLGGEVRPGIHDYEAFIYEAPGIRLTFYPHKTSAQNYHIRVRASANTERKKLEAAIYALAENTCTFQFPADTELHNKAVRAALDRDFKK